jgi:ribosomal protein S18 acetylase RimI-like enzyme
LIDVECEEEPGTVCWDRPGLGGMIWHLGVVPELRRQGIATRLLAAAEETVRERGIVRLEAWTRDDGWVQRWYESHGFERVYSYLHVYVDGRDEIEGAIRSELPGLKAIKVFAQYTDDEGRDAIRARFERVHDCVLYERLLDA